MRIMIAEDSVLLREGLSKLLQEAGFTMCAQVGDAEALHAALERERPDVAIVDVRMPPSYTDEGLRAALELRRRHPGVAVLVLSQYVEERYAAELLAGHPRGIGYLLKDRVADFDEFLDALRRVADGQTVLDPEVVSQLMARRGADPVDQLTRRENDVIRLMAEGRSNSGIAGELVVSESAVAKHVNSIFTKLGIEIVDGDHRRVLAVLRYLRIGGSTGG